MEAVAHLNYKRSAPGRGRYISERDSSRERDCRLGIARNYTASTFRPNNEYWKRSPTEIIKGALPRGDGTLASAIGRAKEVAFSELREIARVAYLGLITCIGRGPAIKL